MPRRPADQIEGRADLVVLRRLVIASQMMASRAPSNAEERCSVPRRLKKARRRIQSKAFNQQILIPSIELLNYLQQPTARQLRPCMALNKVLRINCGCPPITPRRYRHMRSVTWGREESPGDRTRACIQPAGKNSTRLSSVDRHELSPL